MEAGLQFLLVSTVGILSGLLIGLVMVAAHKKIKDNAVVEISLSLLTPFAAYLLAEHFHTSGVLAVVTAGLFISWRSREIFSPETRLKTKVVWDIVIFLLNGVIFILIGLQMPGIVKDIDKNSLFQLVGHGLIISLVTIVIRILWVFAGANHQNILAQKRQGELRSETNQAAWKNVLIVAWTGTRGVVSLATALALPLTLSDGNSFSQRPVILLLAFIVILVTLVVQGLTLPLLIKLLKIEPQTNVQKREEKNLSLTVTENVLRFIDKEFPFKLDEKVLIQIRKPYEANFNLLSTQLSDENFKPPKDSRYVTFISQMLSARLELVKFKRELLINFHKDGTYNDETISKAERELDLEDLRLQAMIQKGEDRNIEIRHPEQ